MDVKHSLKKIFLAGLGLGSLGLAFFAYANILITQNANQIYSVSSVPTSSLAIIFGGGMKNNGTEMSDMQWDRVEVGAELFKLKKVEQVMITGDDGWFRADEISAMRARLITLGVSEQKILIDPHGYRTYESCLRESELFKINQAIVISQSFHLPRIQYLCEHFGIETTLVQADLRAYESWWVPNAREWLARVKAVWQIQLTKPGPMTWEK